VENEVFEYIINNKEWIFSGLGVAVISWVFLRKSSSKKMTQRSGDNSTNIQVGGNINMSDKGKGSEDK
jgi:hypothetical protein